MAQPVIQHSFNTGEWAPALNARVDLQKYHSAAALMLNYFVDYRGGASTRAGTKWIIQAYKSSTAVRLIRFQASFSVNYVLEFGDFYIRFIYNGSVILETAKAITGATQANPCVLTVPANGYNVGDWFYANNIVGMTQLNGKYFKVIAATTNTISLGSILDGSNINSTGYGAYVSGGTVARVYTLPSPYAAADLALLKFAQNVNTLTLTHPSYVPYVLTLIASNNWTIAPIVFGASISAPGGLGVATTLSAGNVNYAYVVTSVDSNGQESGPSAFATLASKTDLRTTAGTNTVSWSAITGAIYYNVYKSELSYAGAVPTGASFGFIGFTSGVLLIDSNIAPDFSDTPPIAQNPFQGAGVISTLVTAPGTYTTAPTVTFAAAPSGGITATGSAVLQVQGTPTVPSLLGANYNVGDSVTFSNGVTLIVATVNATRVATWRPIAFPGSNPGSATGATPSNPVTQVATSGAGTGAEANLTWGVGFIQLNSPGAGYLTTPGITFSSGAATATATLGPSSNGNPAVPSFFQQRFVLAAQVQAPQSFNMSKPGNYYNFDISNPIQADDAISGSIVSTILSTIKAMIPMPSGLMVLGDQSAWQVNGGSAGAAITPIDATAQAQSYNGCSDVPPIVANADILYVQAKGSIVRNLTYNFYTNIWTGTDISVLSSHLFYGYTVVEWAWAEEPFKVVWAVRNDGDALSLTFLKEQELIGWTHSDTQGLFKSVTSIVETVSFGIVDAVYWVVQRTINGTTVQYIERMAERIFLNGAEDAWCVDAGLQYSGAPTATFSGGEHLAGATVTGLADGVVIPSFVMPVNGNFTLTSAASKVTVGLAFTPKLKTLGIDLGEPTVQSKTKKIPAVTLRVQDTLGLSIGQDFDHLVPMKDLVVGNVSSMLTGQESQLITDLVTGDARTIIGPAYTVPGQYCIEQPYPLPATILGVIPQITVGDTGK